MEQFETYFNSALRFLSFRPRSEKEVREYLFRHSGKPKAHLVDSGSSTRMTDVVDQVIAKLKEKNFLNDEDFAKWWIESRTRFKQRSIKLIILELKQKGISQDNINAIIHPPAGEAGIIQNDLEQAKKLVEKKIEKYKGLSKQELYQKLGGFLARRGFDYDTIKQSIDEVLTKGV